MDRGSKFVPCIHFTDFAIFNFILSSFETNFNNFNSRLNLSLKNFNRRNKDNSTQSQNLNLTINASNTLLDCFSEKCKKLRNSFNSLKFPTSKASLDFKFSFFKSLKDLNFNHSFNISKQEIFYLKKFVYEKNFKIIDCDKNVGTCFISTLIYDEIMSLHLNNPLVYLNLANNPLEETQKNILVKLNFLLINRHLTKRIYSKLINKNSKLGNIRLLAKLHKDKLGFRPIINCVSHPTLFLCLLIDIILQPFVKKTASFLLDSQNLIQKTQNIKFPKNSKLFSCDFESLYTNINLSHALIVICEFITRNFTSTEISSQGFYEILKLIFENNIFGYKNKYFKQISGIAMGAKCAPSIANLYIAILEKNFQTIHKPLLYFRFIDDIFVILHELFDINILTNSFEYLKLNVVSEESVNFLDLIISLDPITGYLVFSLYTKPTNTFSYLLSSSNHPNFIFNNIPKSIFIRIRRICTNLSDFLFFARKITIQLIARGYDKIKIRKLSRTVANMDRAKLLPYKIKNNKYTAKENLLFFKFPFDKNFESVKTALNSAFNSISSIEELDNTNFKVINNIQNNLSSIFVHEFKIFATKKHFYRRCRDPGCSICYYSNENYFILINGFYLPFMADTNCKSIDIIYILTCKLCNSYYIGQSISAGCRLKIHIRDCRKNRTSSNCVCVYKHFNSSDHGALKYFTFNIFNKNITGLFKRLSLETQLIHLFLKLDAKLINAKIPNLYYLFPNVSLFVN